MHDVDFALAPLPAGRGARRGTRAVCDLPAAQVTPCDAGAALSRARRRRGPGDRGKELGGCPRLRALSSGYAPRPGGPCSLLLLGAFLAWSVSAGAGIARARALSTPGALQGLGRLLRGLFPPEPVARLPRAWSPARWPAPWPSASPGPCWRSSSPCRWASSRRPPCSGPERCAAAEGPLAALLLVPTSQRAATLRTLRAVPELLWALLFVVAVGLGPRAGALALGVSYAGVLGRVYADLLEEVDPSPVEALAATGGRRAVPGPVRARPPGAAGAGELQPLLARVRHPLGDGAGVRRRGRNRPGAPALDAAVRVPAGLHPAAGAARPDARGRGGEPAAPAGDAQRPGGRDDSDRAPGGGGSSPPARSPQWSSPSTARSSSEARTRGCCGGWGDSPPSSSLRTSRRPSSPPSARRSCRPGGRGRGHAARGGAGGRARCRSRAPG